MIARFAILLPFDLFVREGDELPTLDLSASAYQIRVHPLAHSTERPKPTDSVLRSVSSLENARVAPFTETLQVGGRRTAQVNVLVMDFSKPEFDRTAEPNVAADPAPELAFGIANLILARIRVYSRAFDIRPLEIDRDPWRIGYLADNLQELEPEQGKVRGRVSSFVRVGFAAITPDIIEMVAPGSQTDEPYVWDQLLLDAYALLPDVGGAVVMAYAAMETFIAWALDILHEEQQLPKGLWGWINKRDHWTKEPSVSEKFDILLRVFTGHSLKDEPQLWERFTEVRKARNALVHEGAAKVGAKPVDAGKARELVNDTGKIIKWVELLLPEARRRARTDARGPFSRRLATPDEASALDPTALGLKAPDQNQGSIRIRREQQPEQ